MFEFDVYFENLTKEELALLIWCLELENSMLHKLGHGKPLGLGTIKINIDHENSYLVYTKQRYLDIRSNAKTSLKDFQLKSSIERVNGHYWLKCKCNTKEVARFEIKNKTTYEDLAMILTPHSKLFDQIKYPAYQCTGFKWFANNPGQQLHTIGQTVAE